MVCAKIEVLLSAMANSCLTPQEIADKAGVGVNTIYRMRKGYLVRMEALGKVCKALGLDCADVIDYERLRKLQTVGD